MAPGILSTVAATSLPAAARPDYQEFQIWASRMTEPTRRDGVYQVGYYALRIRRGAILSPAEIRYEPPRDPLTGKFLDRSWSHIAYINGKPRDGRYADYWLDQINWFGVWITREKYHQMLRTVEWAKKSAPDLPEANPTQAVDLGKMRPLF